MIREEQVQGVQTTGALEPKNGRHAPPPPHKISLPGGVVAERDTGNSTGGGRPGGQPPSKPSCPASNRDLPATGRAPRHGVGHAGAVPSRRRWRRSPGSSGTSKGWRRRLAASRGGPRVAVSGEGGGQPGGTPSRDNRTHGKGGVSPGLRSRSGSSPPVVFLLCFAHFEESTVRAPSPL